MQNPAPRRDIFAFIPGVLRTGPLEVERTYSRCLILHSRSRWAGLTWQAELRTWRTGVHVRIEEGRDRKVDETRSASFHRSYYCQGEVQMKPAVVIAAALLLLLLLAPARV